MAETEIVRTIKVRGVPEGLENLTAQLKRAEQAYSGVGTAASGAGTATETSARKLNTTERSYQSLTERLDSTARLYRQLQTDTRTLSGAFDAGFMGKGAEAAARFNAQLTQIQRNLQDVGGRMATGNAGLDAMFGIGRASGSARDSAAVFEEQAKSIQRLRQQYDPLGVAQERYAEAVRDADAFLKQGVLTQGQHVTITANARKILDDTTKAYNGAFTAQSTYGTGAGLARHELVNLSRQIQDVGISLASGQSPLTVLIQQGTQIADVFAASRTTMAGFFAQAVRGAAGFAASGAGLLTGGLLIGAGALASAYKYAESQKAVELALMGVGRASGMSVAGINRVAEASAEAGKISVSAARDIASIFAGTGRIDSSLITSNLVDTATRGYGNLIGKGQKEAAQELAQALASPTAGAAELQKRLGSLSDAQMQFIRSAEASGNRTAAQKALFDAYNPTLQEAANKTILLARAWEAVAKGASNAAEAIGKAVTGPNLEEQIAKLQAGIAARTARQNMPYPTSGNRRSVTADMQAELDVLLRAQRRNREAREFATADARANQLSGQAGEALRNLFGDATRLKNLEDQARLLEEISKNAAAMAKLDPSIAGKLGEGIDRLNSSIANFETTEQRIARDFQLQAQQIDAYTLGQKAAVEAERARLEAIRAGRGELQAGVEAEQARTRTIMEANRQLRDTARDLKDAGSLIGLSPYQRSLRENANASRRERETLTMGGAASGPLSRNQILDLIEKHESGGRNIHQNVVGPNGGYNPSTGTITGPSSAQGYFQMTNPTWRDAARMAGIDLKQFPTAMSASYDDQRKAAGALYDARGVSPWAPYNANLRSALAGQGVGAANDNGAARNANTMREAYEGWNTPLANANRTLDAQIALQQRAQQTWSMSAAEITAAAEKQKLLNEYAQQGIPITDSLRQGIDAYASRAGAAAQATAQFQDSLDAMKAVGDLGRSVLGGMVSDLRNGATSAEMFRNALNKIVDKLLEMAMNDLFGRAFGNNAMGLFSGGSGGGGFFGSLFGGFGGGGGIGLTPGSGGLYASGGYTGAGGKYDPAGIVHRGEYVFSAASVGKIGLGNLDSMHRSALRGYADGGYVSPTPYMHPTPPANANAPRSANVNVNVNNQTGTAATANARAEVGPDGSIDVVVDLIEARMAERAASGRSGLNDVFQRDAQTMRG